MIDTEGVIISGCDSKDFERIIAHISNQRIIDIVEMGFGAVHTIRGINLNPALCKMMLENFDLKNMYGMGFDHSFGLWFIMQWLKPDLMIESGAFKGHSTWVLRQAMPDKPIVSLSPRHPEKYLKKGPAYVDENCTYFAGKDLVDFGSVDWEKVMKKHGITDRSRVLIFFDDHQNELKR